MLIDSDTMELVTSGSDSDRGMDRSAEGRGDGMIGSGSGSEASVDRADKEDRT